MPVAVWERSAFQGQPVQLYEFIRTSGGVDFFWRYNTSDRDITYNSVLYKAVPISDDGIRLSSEAASTEFNVTMPIAEDFCDQFRLSGTVPSDTVWLRVRRVHVPDITLLDTNPTILEDALVVWQGTVNGITQTDDLTARVSCSMLAASFQRGGLRYGYQRSCPHVLYAENTCTLDREDFKITAIVTAIDGSTISADEFTSQPIGWLNGGFIEFTLPSGMIERRMILGHTDNMITIQGFPVGMLVADEILAFAGCDRTVATCVAKFDNLVNMGGFPHTPGRNPFDGMPVF